MCISTVVLIQPFFRDQIFDSLRVKLLNRLIIVLFIPANSTFSPIHSSYQAKHLSYIYMYMYSILVLFGISVMYGYNLYFLWCSLIHDSWFLIRFKSVLCESLSLTCSFHVARTCTIQYAKEKGRQYTFLCSLPSNTDLFTCKGIYYYYLIMYWHYITYKYIVGYWLLI